MNLEVPPLHLLLEGSSRSKVQVLVLPLRYETAKGKLKSKRKPHYYRYSMLTLPSSTPSVRALGPE